MNPRVFSALVYYTAILLGGLFMAGLYPELKSETLKIMAALSCATALAAWLVVILNKIILKWRKKQ